MARTAPVCQPVRCRFPSSIPPGHANPGGMERKRLKFIPANFSPCAGCGHAAHEVLPADTRVADIRAAGIRAADISGTVTQSHFRGRCGSGSYCSGLHRSGSGIPGHGFSGLCICCLLMRLPTRRRAECAPCARPDKGREAPHERKAGRFVPAPSVC